MIFKKGGDSGNGSDGASSGWETFKDGLYDLVEMNTSENSEASNTKSNTKAKSNTKSNDAKAANVNVQGDTGDYANALDFPKPTPPVAKFLEQQPAQTQEITTPQTQSPPVKNAKIAPGQRFMDQYNANEKGSLPSTTSTSIKIDNDNDNANANANDNPTDNISAGKPDNPISNIQKDVTSSPTAGKYDEDLNSRNPLKWIKAKVTIQAEELQRNRRIAAAKRTTQINNIKEIIFSIVDSVENLYQTIIKLPSDIETSVEDGKAALEDINAKVQSTLDEIQKTPAKVQDKVDQTKNSVKETQRKTMEIVEEVQGFPSRVQSAVVDTRESLENTKDRVQKAVDDTRESFDNTKDRVQKAVGDARETLENTKETVGKFASKIEDLASSNKDTASTSSEQAIRPPTIVTKATSIADIDPGLQTEVAQALQVAKDALSSRSDDASTVGGDNANTDANADANTDADANANVSAASAGSTKQKNIIKNS